MKKIRDFDAKRDTAKTGTIIVLVGLPRSGKSTWSKRQGYPIVSKDAIRLAVHGKRYDAWVEPLISGLTPLFVDALFQAGHETVILDECNVTVKHREKWVNRGYFVKIKYFDTPAEECKRRAVLTSQEDLFPVIDSMADALDLDGIDSHDWWEE